MNKKTLLLSIFSVFSYLAITSYSGGPAHGSLGNLTGSPGSTETCGKTYCHGGGSGLPPTGTIELRKKSTGENGPLVTSYAAGETYYVTILGSGSQNHFGFQLLALKNSDSSKVGLFSGFPANAHGFPHTAPTLAEHNTPIAKTGIGQYKVVFQWTAPMSGVGAVTLHGIINAVDNNNQPTGDLVSAPFSLNLLDKTSVGEVSREVVFKAYPNPVQNILTLDLTKADAGTYTVQAYTTSGSLVTQTEIEIDSRVYTGVINTADWKPGLYFVRIQKDGDTRVIPILKQ